jgi:hypothetical protein
MARKRGKKRKHGRRKHRKNPSHKRARGRRHSAPKRRRGRRRRNPGGPVMNTLIAAGIGVGVGLLGSLAINKLGATLSPGMKSGIRAAAAGAAIVLGAPRDPVIAAGAAAALLLPVGQTLIRMVAPDAPIGAVEYQMGAVDYAYLPAPSMEAVEYMGAVEYVG